MDPRPLPRLALRAALTLALAGLGTVHAEQRHLGAGALFESSRQAAADQARQTEAGAAAQVRKSLPAVSGSALDGLGLPGSQGREQGRAGTQDAPYGTGYERRMERAAAAAGLSIGSPSRPSAGGAAAGAGAAGGGGGQGSGRGRR